MIERGTEFVAVYLLLAIAVALGIFGLWVATR